MKTTILMHVVENLMSIQKNQMFFWNHASSWLFWYIFFCWNELLHTFCLKILHDL